jgi:acyl carrier protein
MATQKEIIEAIADILALPPGDIDPRAHIQDDMGLNPVEKADLLHNLAAKFKIVFVPGESETIETIGDVVDLIEDKLLE